MARSAAPKKSSRCRRTARSRAQAWRRSRSRKAHSPGTLYGDRERNRDPRSPRHLAFRCAAAFGDPGRVRARDGGRSHQHRAGHLGQDAWRCLPARRPRPWDDIVDRARRRCSTLRRAPCSAWPRPCSPPGPGTKAPIVAAVEHALGWERLKTLVADTEAAVVGAQT